MSLVDHIDLHQSAPTNWPGTTINPIRDAILDRLERAAATTRTHVLALPALIAHRLISAVAYR